MPERYCLVDPYRLAFWVTVGTGLVTFIKWLRKGFVANVEDRYVLVTGCDTGFGYRLALRLDGMGCYVFAACLTPEGAGALTKETSERVYTFLMDITKDDDISRAVEHVSQILPRDQGLWALVNNAGVMGPLGPIEILTRAHLIHVLNINTLGMTQVTRAFLPLIRKERGRVVNALSMEAWFPFGPGPYVISQAASTAYNDVLRLELYQHGISVHAIMAGPYITSLTDLNNQRQLLSATYARASPYARLIYGDDYVEQMIGIIERRLKFCADTNLEDVVDAFVHAIFARAPKTHYVKGRFARFYLRPLVWLPAWLSTVLVQMGYPYPRDQGSGKSMIRSMSRLFENVQMSPMGPVIVIPERRSSRLSVSSRRSFNNEPEGPQEPAAEASSS